MALIRRMFGREEGVLVKEMGIGDGGARVVAILEGV